jgi:hypothetical protein
MPDNPPGSGIPLIGDAISLLTSIFSNRQQVQDLANQVDKVEQGVWQNAISVASWSYTAFGDTFTGIASLLDGLKKFLGHLFRDLIFGHILGILKFIWKQLTDKHSWLRRMIAWLQQLQKMQRQYQLQTLKKVVSLIQRVRRILLPFKLLHLKFAKKLDAWLGGVEGKLITGTFALARKTNEILGWVNVLVDPKGLMRGWPLGTALGRDMAALASAAAALDLKVWFPKQLKQTWTPAGATPAKPLQQI